MDNDKIEMIPVPLPTEVPAPPSLANLPLDVVHSATVEMLIQQNEDLSARLKVNIRRNSQLELRILELSEDKKQLNAKLDNILAQNEIIKEKHEIWSQQKESKDRQLESQEKETSLLETRYNELYVTSQLTQKNQRKELIAKQHELERLKNKLKILNSVRDRAKEKLRSFLLQTVEQFQSMGRKNQQLESSHRLLQNNFQTLKNETIEKENFFKAEFEKFKTASGERFNQEVAKREAAEFANKLLEQNKEQLAQEINSWTEKYHIEKKQRSKVQQLSEELTQVRNKQIKDKRQLENQIERSEESRQNEIDRARKIKLEKNELEKQLREQGKTLEACEVKLLELAKDNKEISSQLESLQKLWIQAQENLEREEARRQGLEKINRELSRDFNEDRTQRSIQASQSTTTTKNTKPSDVKKQSFAEVYGSQYVPLGKGPEMDL